MNSPDDNEGSSQKVLIDGATGYLGSHLTHYLSTRGYKVSCLVHSQAKPVDRQYLCTWGAQIYQADLEDDCLQRDGKAVEQAFNNIDVAIHLIGSVAPKRHETLEQLHTEQTRIFTQLCLKYGVKKVIIVTTLGASAESSSLYQRTKWQAEQVLRDSGISCLILRPSLLIGKEVGRRDSKLVSRLCHLINGKGVIPLVNGGRNKIQPLYIGDMVAAIDRCILSIQAASGKEAPILNLAGPEVLSMEDFVNKLMLALGVPGRVVSMPPSIAKVLAFILGLIQEVPVLSRDQIALSLQDNVVMRNDLIEKLSIVPRGIEEALNSYKFREELPSTKCLVEKN